MLRKLRPRSVFDVMAAIAFVIALAGGTAYAANTVRTGDIVDNEVFTTDVRDDTLGFGGLQSQDLGPNSVGQSEIRTSGVFGPEVADGALIDRDIAQGNGVFRNFTGTIGLVPAHGCVYRRITGVNGDRDHLLLTPNFETASSFLTYGIEYHDTAEYVEMKVCNPTGGNVDDGTTRFNLLVINGLA
jgi:hypothetical protein